VNEDDGIKSSDYRKYISSLYFVMTTLSTCGFGDISGTSTENFDGWIYEEDNNGKDVSNRNYYLFRDKNSLGGIKEMTSLKSCET